MNTNQLKKFAQEARRKLIQQVGARLEFVLTTDSVELREKTEHLKRLREELTKTTRDHLIEKVAYTWFNRLMALRFMDANDYQPLGIRVVTPKDGYSVPELLDEAKQGHIQEDIKLNRQRMFDLLDNRLQSSNPQNEAYKELLIAACNHFSTVFPFLFERINDYTELLLPDDLTSEFSIVTVIRKGMLLKDCNNVEIIGWLYQFYISEKKDEVFALKEKVKKEDIPSATQLFTPRWIVEYMVQNTVGKLWLQNRPNSKLREHMPYFIESESLKSEEFQKIDSPEEIKLLDPACGSGHILVYAFDLLTKVYEEEGYNSNDIPKLIIEKNLYGFEIDERAAQLSGFALMMKARKYQRRVFLKNIQPNILTFADLRLSSDEIKSTLNFSQIKASDELMHDLNLMQQATNFGSLIVPHADENEMVISLEKVTKAKTSNDVFHRDAIDQLSTTLIQLKSLLVKYNCIVANPPYMGGGAMNKELNTFVKDNYPDSKADLMACFMESGLAMLKTKGFLGMINQHSWMFLSSYEGLRKKLLTNILFDTLLHLGARTFPEISGEVVQNTSFTFWNNKIEEKGAYIRLVDNGNSELKRTKTLKAINNTNCGWFFTANQKDFEKIPGSPIGYWLSEKFIEIFEILPSVSEHSILRQGMATTNNLKYLKYWFEISIKNIGFGLSPEDSISTENEWFPYNKGGAYRKWYGNNEYVINYTNNGLDLLELVKNKYPRISDPEFVIKNRKDYFKEGVTWSSLSSGAISFRYSPQGFIFDAKGQMLYTKDCKSVMAFMNTKLANKFLETISPTLDFNLGYIEKIPYKSSKIDGIDYFIKESKLDWDSHEISWDFQQNEFIRIKGQDLEETYDIYQQYWKNKFFHLHKNEEELNRQFIKMYGLQEELTQDVPFGDITILKEETSIENGQLTFHVDEVFAQLISYAVGCMFGRYSLDEEGLILANQGETLQDYLHKVEKSEGEVSFLPDEDNIIPVLDDEWFEDDIVGRFYEFLKVTFGDKNFSKNLSFIEEKIGKDIRKYFTKDFYKDHIKRYKKRPIYWMFSSPNGSFNVLIYLHCYTQDTISEILNKYLREFQLKLNSRKEHLQQVEVSGSASEKTKALKERDKIEKILIELKEYERDILHPLATERIEIDLDDGVLVNYNKFGKAIKEVKGLNDKKTKEKVRKFDWIDISTIR